MELRPVAVFVNCICKCMYKALTNQILQSLAVSVRHRGDFCRDAMNGAVSSQLGDPYETAGGDMGTICGYVKEIRNATHFGA